MSDVTEPVDVFDVHGRRLAVGRDHGALYFETALTKLLFEGAELDKLREAIDRAAMREEGADSE